MLMQLLRTIAQIFTPTPPKPQSLCVLPRPVQKVAKGKAAAPVRDSYLDDKETNRWGFHHGKEAERTGAEKWLTGFDKEALRERDLLGVGRKVQIQNEKCKERWATGDSVAECMAAMGKSDSWVEKRYAAFGAALSKEGEGVQ